MSIRCASASTWKSEITITKMGITIVPTRSARTAPPNRNRSLPNAYAAIVETTSVTAVEMSASCVLFHIDRLNVPASVTVPPAARLLVPWSSS